MFFRSIVVLLLLLLLCSNVNARRSDTILRNLLGRFVRSSSRPSHARRSLAEPDEASGQADFPDKQESVEILRSKIAEHRIKLSRMEQESKDLSHEKDFLEKSIELKKGQANMQDGQVKLSQAALEEQAKEIGMYKREAPRTLQRYNELIRRQRHLQQTLTRLHRQSEELTTTKRVIMNKIHNLTVEDLVEHHARALPDAMAGALRKGAAVLIPFFDYLVIAADTNNRLVDHVGTEIDKYTHVNISSSPFLSDAFSSHQRKLPCLPVSSSDPLRIWSKRYETSFVTANLVLATYFMWHTAMLALQTALCFDRRNLSQFVATVTVGIHYFLFAWRKVFTDSPPVMYTFNYMMYATIFGFVLYERYSRMSSRQVNDNGIIRLVRNMVQSIENSFGDLKKVKNLGGGLFDSLTVQRPPSRRLSRRHVRVVSDKRKHRSDRADRLTSKKAAPTDSEDSEDEEKGQSSHHRFQRNGATPHSHSKNGKRSVPQDEDKPSEGFISMFFGNGRETESSTSEEDESESTRSFWSMFRRNIPESRALQDSRPTPRSSNRYRDKKVRQRPRVSMWKWS
ncbi:hypothetical protein FGB62_58g142 [Gracilaria domingensis]|nr:hypothetical protein FGB62_58g142 [Gracilaria domingensis]